jgi:hypothetical protein
MKNLIVCCSLCLALVFLPCLSRAEDHPVLAKTGDTLSFAMAGAALGVLIGTIVSATTQRTTGTFIGAGLVGGACLGMLLAQFIPPPEEESPPEAP